MSVELARVDERLIHGQVMTAWVKRFWIQRIVLVDDELAQDEFMKQVLAMSAPAGVTVDVKTARAAAEELEADGGEHLLLLFKEIRSALALVKAGYRMKKLNIGNVGGAPGRSAITERYMSLRRKRPCCVNCRQRRLKFTYRSFLRTAGSLCLTSYK